MYAGAQRRLAKDEGKKFYELVPDEAEWSEAQRLAKKFNVGAVIFGHSHAAALAAEGRTYITEYGDLDSPDQAAGCRCK